MKELNEHEQAVLRTIQKAGVPLTIEEIGRRTFPRYPDSYRRAVNNLRAPVAAGLLRKVSRGTYEAVQQAAPDPRTEALRRIKAGESERSVARDLKIPRSTIHDWRRHGAMPRQTEVRP